MPSTPPKPCLHPGCGALITTGNRCPAHATQPTARQRYDLTTRRNDPALAAAARFRSSADWQRLSAWFRAQHPLCCDPFGRHADLPALTDAVHHVIPLHLRPDLGLVDTNLRPLCIRCHNRIEGMERRGDSTAVLFQQNRQNLPYV